MREEGEAARKDGRFVAQHLQRPDKLLRALGERNAAQSTRKPALRAIPSSRATRRRKLSWNSISPRIADSVMAGHPVANAGHLRQLVNHLALNQRRVHVEGKKTAVAPETLSR